MYIYIYIYVYMYVYIYICIYVSGYTIHTSCMTHGPMEYIHIYICTHIHIYIYTYKYIFYIVVASGLRFRRKTTLERYGVLYMGMHHK